MIWPFAKRRVTILSIDGGGVRGLIPALILKEINNRLRELAVTRPFHDLFDLIAGTSTGGLIALGLSLPQPDVGTRRERRATAFLNIPWWNAIAEEHSAKITIDHLINMYTRRGQEIFPRGHFNSLRSVTQVFTDKYDVRPFEAILADTFGDATMRDALTDVLVTAFDTERRKPFFFRKRGSKRERSLNFLMKDAARATSAAPTYFEPAQIAAVPSHGRPLSLVDGGVFANNPAVCAYLEAKQLFPQAAEFLILSLGTGIPTLSYPYETVKRWGSFEWVAPHNGFPLFTMMTEGQSAVGSMVLDHTPGVDYVRINGELVGSPRAEIDDAGRENIAALTRSAERLISQFDAELNRVCALLAT